MPTELRFLLPGGEARLMEIRQVSFAGYSGRTAEAVAQHSQEMLDFGVTAPTDVPVFYSVLPCLLSQSSRLHVVGPTTRAEVEFVLAWSGGDVLVTVGNDQFDLEMERAFSPARSKNVGEKVVAPGAWRLTDVMPHWDQLRLRLECRDGVIQDSAVAEILKPADLMDAARSCGIPIREGLVLFSGTVPRLRDDARFGDEVAITLADPVLGRRIRHCFTVMDIETRG